MRVFWICWLSTGSQSSIYIYIYIYICPGFSHWVGMFAFLLWSLYVKSWWPVLISAIDWLLPQTWGPFSWSTQKLVRPGDLLGGSLRSKFRISWLNLETCAHHSPPCLWGRHQRCPFHRKNKQHQVHLCGIYSLYRWRTKAWPAPPSARQKLHQCLTWAKPHKLQSPLSVGVLIKSTPQSLLGFCCTEADGTKWHHPVIVCLPLQGI